MFRGFFALLDTATARHLVIGAGVALLLVAAFAIFQRATADPGDYPGQWLTANEERDLQQAIASLEAGGAWVAGCLWDGDDRQITEVVDVPPGPQERYSGEASSGRTMAFVVVAVDRSAVDAYEARQQRGAYCLVPGGPDR